MLCDGSFNAHGAVDDVEDDGAERAADDEDDDRALKCRR